MDYVLYVYGSVVFVAAYGAVWNLSGQRGKLVLTLGAYSRHPRYVPQRPNRLVRGHPDHRPREGYASWRDFLPAASPDLARPRFIPIMAAEGSPLAYALATASPEQLRGLDEAPTVTIPRLVHADIEKPGAEGWGDLLADMNTEEREIYSAELVMVYESTKDIERPALEELDEIIARFTAANEAGERRDAAVLAGIGVNLAKRHGGADRWSTGQFPIYEAAIAAV